MVCFGLRSEYVLRIGDFSTAMKTKPLKFHSYQPIEIASDNSQAVVVVTLP